MTQDEKSEYNMQELNEPKLIDKGETFELSKQYPENEDACSDSDNAVSLDSNEDIPDNIDIGLEIEEGLENKVNLWTLNQEGISELVLLPEHFAKIK